MGRSCTDIDEQSGSDHGLENTMNIKIDHAAVFHSLAFRIVKRLYTQTHEEPKNNNDNNNNNNSSHLVSFAFENIGCPINRVALFGLERCNGSWEGRTRGVDDHLLLTHLLCRS